MTPAKRLVLGVASVFGSRQPARSFRGGTKRCRKVLYRVSEDITYSGRNSALFARNKKSPTSTSTLRPMTTAAVVEHLRTQLALGFSAAATRKSRVEAKLRISLRGRWKLENPVASSWSCDTRRSPYRDCRRIHNSEERALQAGPKIQLTISYKNEFFHLQLVTKK